LTNCSRYFSEDGAPTLLKNRILYIDGYANPLIGERAILLLTVDLKKKA